MTISLSQLKFKSGFTLIEIMVVIAIIATLAGMGTPMALKQMKKRDLLTATNNGRQIYLAMSEFEGDFGSFPDDYTATRDPDLADFTGNDANVYLGQLIQSGVIEDEGVFALKDGASVKGAPDNIISDGNILTAGENGFSYIMEEEGVSFSTSDKSSIPILVGAMDHKDPSKTKFNSSVFGGKALVIRIDGSAKQERINKSGQVVLPDGKSLFDSSEDGIWEGYAPHVYLPK